MDAKSIRHIDELIALMVERTTFLYERADEISLFVSREQLVEHVRIVNNKIRQYFKTFIG